jgi:ribonuclease HI
VKNHDIWHEIVDDVNRQKASWSWSKGLASLDDNNRCDELATMAARTQSAS